MKILYVANQRSPAQLAATALRLLAEDVRVEWAGDLSGASTWVHYNRDVAAVVVEDGPQYQSCAPFVDHVRSLGLAVPVIVVCPDDVTAPLLALKAGADDYIVGNQSLLTNLPVVVGRALQRAQATAQRSGTAPLRLLYAGDAALARHCLENSGWSIEISEPEPASDGTLQPIPPASAGGGDLRFDVLLVEHDHPRVDAFAILKEIASRGLNVRVILVVEWDEKLAIPAMKLGASDCVVKAADAFRALFFRLDRIPADGPVHTECSTLAAEESVRLESLERQVREARAAAAHFRERESRLQATIDQDRDRRHALETELEHHRKGKAALAEAVRIRRTLEDKLAGAEAALAESEQQRALEAAESADHLANRSGEYRATLAQSLRARDALKQQLNDRTAALEGRLVQEAARYRALEEARETDADAARAQQEEAERRHASKLAAAAAQLSERQAEHDAALEQAVAARQAIEQELVDAEAALEAARQAAAADAQAGAERFRLREEQLVATISDVTAARSALERRVVETEHAMQRARQDSAAAELAAAEQAAQLQAECEALRAQEADTRTNLGQALAEADTAREATAARLASAVATAAAQLAEHQARSDRARSDAAAAEHALRQQLGDVTAALDRALEEQAVDAAAAADRLARREAELGVRIAETVTAREALAETLGDAESALAAALERAAAERSAAVQQTAQLQTEFEGRLARDAAARATLEQRLTVAEVGRQQATAALEDARQRHLAEAAAARDHGARREAELGAAVADAIAGRDALAQQLVDATSLCDALEQRAAEERVTAVRDTSQRQIEFDALVAAHAATQKALEQTRADADTARQDAQQRHVVHIEELAAATARFAEQQAARDADLTQAVRSRQALEQQLREATEALEVARHERASESAVAADQRAHLERLSVALEQAATARQAVERQLVDAEAALEESERGRTAATQQVSHASEALDAARQAGAADVHAGAERLRLREVALGVTIAELTNARDTLETRVTETEDALQRASQHAAAVELAAAQQAEQLQAEFEAQRARDTAARGTLEQRLTDAEVARRQATAALEDTRQRHLAEAAAARDHLGRREAELGAAVADAIAGRDALAQQLVDATSLCDALEQRAAEERVTAVRDASQRQTEFDALVAAHAATNTTLEQTRADADRARQDAQQRDVLHIEELAAATARLAEQQTAHDAALTQAARSRQALEQQLREAAAMLDAALQTAAADAHAGAERLKLREVDLGVTIAELTSARDTLATRVTEAEDALQHASQHAAAVELAAAQHAAQLQAEAAAAIDRLARREVELAATIQEGIDARAVLEQELADAEMSRQQAAQQYTSERAAAAARLAAHQAEHDAMTARAAAVQSELDETLEETATALATRTAERDTLHESLGRTQEQLQRLTDAHHDARHTHARARAASEDEHRRLSAEYASLQETLGRLRTQFEALERTSAAHAAEHARLDGVVTERDAQLSEQAAMHQASQHAAQQALTQMQEKLRLALETSGREMARFENELGTLRQELIVTRRDRDALRTQADRLPHVLTERDESRADNRRLFDHSPVGQCRCNRDGALTQINRALVGLLGYRTGDELRKVDFAKTIFESADDLQWLIERCLESGTAETLEATWRRQNGRRIVVKLVGVAASPESIDIVVEEITEVRELEERIRRAHPMEAVGRLASEVAATCDNLLRDVSQDGQQWLAAIHDDMVLRRQGEMLLGEVTRAASFLRQLSVYGDRQTMALGPVTLQKVLRDLEPVLKRVAGDGIELVLPKASPALNVDVEPERVERVFVNVASYARERLPQGGRLKIELATVIVDRRFLAKYPSVRPGDHVLITIAEVRGPVETGLSTVPPDDAGGAASQPERPGVDLGALLSLVGECGGHLWMSAEPPGNMVLKIHLPRPAADGQQEHTPVPRPDQRRTRHRWFRH